MLALNLVLIYCLGFETVLSNDYFEYDNDHDTFNDQPFAYPNSPHSRGLKTYQKSRVNASGVAILNSNIYHFGYKGKQRSLSGQFSNQFEYRYPNDNANENLEHNSNIRNFNRGNDEQEYFHKRRFHWNPYRSPRSRGSRRRIGRRYRRRPRYWHEYRSEHRLRPSNFKLKFATKTQYKGVGSGGVNADLLNNKAGVKGAIGSEGNMEAEGTIGDKTSFAASGVSKGEGKGAVIADTFAGTVVAKGNTGHDWSGKARFLQTD